MQRVAYSRRRPYLVMVDGVIHQRPRTLAECPDERPCPWVSCRFHLLLEVSQAILRLNNRTTPNGRRPGLRVDAAGELVRRWIEDAAQLLATMKHTCALDVVHAHPDGLSSERVGVVLSMAKQSVQEEEQKPHVRDAVARLKAYASEDTSL